MPETVRHSLVVAYLGGHFAGWQRQPGTRTVQGELEAGLTRLFGRPIVTVGAGRTDAGVHAVGQVAHADLPGHIPVAGIRAALGSLLPEDLRVLAVRRRHSSFHALADARGKRYRYRFAWGGPVEPWEALRTWCLPSRPDLATMRRCLGLFAGTHDFRRFALSGHSGTGARGTQRTIVAARMNHHGRRASIVVDGDGFLRGMVRRMVGALAEVGRGAADDAWIRRLLSGVEVRPPAPTAPAHGLTLERVFY